MNQPLIWFWTFGSQINAWSSNLTVQKKKMSVKSFFFYYAFSTWVQLPCMIRKKNAALLTKGESKFVYSCWCTLVNNVAGKKMLYHRLWWAPARAAQIAIIQKKGSRKVGRIGEEARAGGREMMQVEKSLTRSWREWKLIEKEKLITY